MSACKHIDRERCAGSLAALRRRGKRGFTLLEILLALALVALVLVAMNSFIFSMGELWGRNTDVRLFDQHVRNVTRFLQAELRNASLPPYVPANKAGVAPQEIKTRAGFPEWMLSFELPEGSRLLNWPQQALPDVVCGLTIREGEGLMLLWHSRHEKRFTQDAPRETVITPLARALVYEYYDPDFKNWKTETALRKNAKGDVESPQRLRLKFEYDGLTRESVITLPTASEGLPLL